MTTGIVAIKEGIFGSVSQPDLKQCRNKQLCLVIYIHKSWMIQKTLNWIVPCCFSILCELLYNKQGWGLISAVQSISPLPTSKQMKFEMSAAHMTRFTNHRLFPYLLTTSKCSQLQFSPCQQMKTSIAGYQCQSTRSSPSMYSICICLMIKKVNIQSEPIRSFSLSVNKDCPRQWTFKGLMKFMQAFFLHIFIFYICWSGIKFAIKSLYIAWFLPWYCVTMLHTTDIPWTCGFIPVLAIASTIVYLVSYILLILSLIIS